MKKARRLTPRILKRTMSVAEMARRARDIRIYFKIVKGDPAYSSLSEVTRAYIELGVKYASRLPSEIEGLLWHRKRRKRPARQHQFHRKLIV